MKLNKTEIALLKRLEVCPDSPYTFFFRDRSMFQDGIHIYTRRKMQQLQKLCEKYGAEYKDLNKKVMTKVYVEVTDPLAAIIERLAKENVYYES